MSKKSTTTQISSSKFDNTNTLSSVGSDFIVVTLGIITVEVSDSFFFYHMQSQYPIFSPSVGHGNKYTSPFLDDQTQSHG